MRNAFFICLLIFLIMSSCNKEEEEMVIPTCENCNFNCLDQSEPPGFTNACAINWDCSFKVKTQSSVDIEVDQGVSTGSKNVFQMVLQSEGNPASVGDESSETIVFELDESQNSFSAEDEDLAIMQFHYQSYCVGCTEVNFKPVSLGCLQGERQPDRTWLVKGVFEVPFSFGGQEFWIDAQFED